MIEPSWFIHLLNYLEGSRSLSDVDDAQKEFDRMHNRYTATRGQQTEWNDLKAVVIPLVRLPDPPPRPDQPPPPPPPPKPVSKPVQGKLF